MSGEKNPSFSKMEMVQCNACSQIFLATDAWINHKCPRDPEQPPSPLEEQILAKLEENRELLLRVCQHLEIVGAHTVVSALCNCGERVQIPPQWQIDKERKKP